MYGHGNRGGMSPPVREGEEIDVTVEAVGEKGDGVAKVQGFVLFVPNTQAGQNVRVKVTRVLAKVGFAEVVGEAQSTPAASGSEPEPEFEANEHLDSESFGEEGDSSDDSEDDSDEEDDEEPEATEEEEEDLDRASLDDSDDSEEESSDSEESSDDSDEENDSEDEEESAEEDSDDEESSDDDSEEEDDDEEEKKE